MIYNEENTRLLPITGFLIVFLVQIGLNFLVPCMRSLPDEMGAIALAAKFAGYDWNYVLTHPSMYYGSGTFPLLVPFFVFVKNPHVLYQCLLGVGAFLHAIPAYIAIRILQKFYKISKSQVVILLVGIGAAFFTPTRATNIDNEPMLIFLCWLLVYFVIALQFTNSKKNKIFYSFFLAFILSVAQLSHTRAFIYSIAIFIMLFAYWIFTKKILIHLGSFFATYIVGMGVATFLTQNLKDFLFTSESTEVVANTPGQVASAVTDNVTTIFSGVSVRSLFDLLFSNFWIIFVFSFGIIIFCIWDMFFSTVNSIQRKVKKNEIENEAMYFPELFCILGILISLAGLCILWLPSAKAVHEEAANLSRGHFYLRYYGNFFGPCFMFFSIKILNKKNEYWTEKKKIFICSLGLLFIAAIYTLVSYLGITSINYQYNIDWFYYFAPFSGMLNSWPNTIQTLSYFACPTVIAIITFLLGYFVKKSRIKILISLLVVMLVWQYAYAVSRFDRPYANSYNYYQSANAISDFYEIDKGFFDGNNIIYYNNDVYGPAYIVQFFLLDKKIITNLESINWEEDNIILSATPLLYNGLNSDYVGVELDENEYLYFNNKERKEILKDRGYSIITIESSGE